MKQSLWSGAAGLSVLAVMAAPVFARAMMIAPAPIPQRVAESDAVVVGKVTAFGDKLVNAKSIFGDSKVDYQIAVVRVEDAFLGAKDAEIKVGFVPPPPPVVPAPGPGPIRIIKRYPQFKLVLDQEACLFLVKHPTEDFYVGVHYYDVINKTGDANFVKSMDEVRRAAKLLADPAAGFKSKEADDHFLTAAILIMRYRTRRVGGPDKTELIDAGQSKQILGALAEADWAPKVGGPFGFRLTPQSVFYRLGLTPKDGWTQPKDYKQTADEAKKWLKDNADKYRIERFVADKDGKKDDK